MKKILFYLLLLSTYGVYAQRNLIGAWKASCPVQYEDRATIRHCELCPTLLDSTRTHLTIQDFDFIVGPTSVTLTKDNVTHMDIPYTWDKERHIMSFSFNEKNYRFSAFYDDDNIVLLNDDLTIVLLKKKKVEIIR